MCNCKRIRLFAWVHVYENDEDYRLFKEFPDLAAAKKAAEYNDGTVYEVAAVHHAKRVETVTWEVT